MDIFVQTPVWFTDMAGNKGVNSECPLCDTKSCRIQKVINLFDSQILQSNESLQS